MIGASAGIGLRHPHLPILATEDDGAPLCAPWVEIHSENFLCDGGPRLAMLDAVRARYPVSCHGVGLSLGSAEGLDPEHIGRLKKLFARVQPALISEHLAWSVTDGIYLNDLLPLPYTEEALKVVSRNVAIAQEAFNRRILVENPSSYLGFTGSAMTEPEFLQQLVANTGCGILLDVNNVYVSAHNNQISARAYLEQIPSAAVDEIHLAGHSVEGQGADQVLIDTHSAKVCAEVWELFRYALQRIGKRPTLIEWDLEIPELAVLLSEASNAQIALDQCGTEPRSHVD